MRGVGRLDEQVTIQSQDGSYGAFGEESINWTDRETFWAKVIFKTVSEKPVDDKEVGMTKVEFLARWFSGTHFDEGYTSSIKSRLKWQSRCFDIEGITSQRRLDMITFHCVEVIP